MKFFGHMFTQMGNQDVARVIHDVLHLIGGDYRVPVALPEGTRLVAP